MLKHLDGLHLGWETGSELCEFIKDNKQFVQQIHLLQKIKYHKGCVNSIAWNETGSLLISGSDDLSIVISDGSSFKPLYEIKTNHYNNIFCAKFFPNSNNNKIVSCAGDGNIIVMNLNESITPIQPNVSYPILINHCEQHLFTCHNATVYEVLPIPDIADTFLSCSEDGTIRLYDMRINLSCIKELCNENIIIDCGQPVSCIAIDPLQTSTIACGCLDGSVRLFDRRLLTTSDDSLSRINRKSMFEESLIGMFGYYIPENLKGDHRVTSIAIDPRNHDIIASYSGENIYLFNTQEFYEERIQDNQILTNVLNKKMNEKKKKINDTVIEGVETLNGNENSDDRLTTLFIRFRGDWSDTGPLATPESVHRRETSRSGIIINPLKNGDSQRPPSHADNQTNSQKIPLKFKNLPNQGSTVKEVTSLTTSEQRSSERKHQKTGEDMASDQTSTYKPIDCDKGNLNASNQLISSSDKIKIQTPIIPAASSTSPINKNVIPNEPDNEETGSGTSTTNNTSADNRLGNMLVKQMTDMLNIYLENKRLNKTTSKRPNNKRASIPSPQLNPHEYDCFQENTSNDLPPNSSAPLCNTNPLYSELPNQPLYAPNVSAPGDNFVKANANHIKRNSVSSGESFIEIPRTNNEPSSQAHIHEVDYTSISEADTHTPASVLDCMNARKKKITFAELIRKRKRSIKEMANQLLQNMPTSSDKNIFMPEGPSQHRHSCNRFKTKQVYTGHRNSRTMIKECNFWGNSYVISGSDCGHIFFWDRLTGQVINVLEADRHVVNCVQPHPNQIILASSGIDYDIKIWTIRSSLDFESESPLNDIERQNKIEDLIERNAVMARETRDIVTIPASFMIRMLAHIRRSMDPREPRADEVNNEPITSRLNNSEPTPVNDENGNNAARSSFTDSETEDLR